MNDQNIIPPEGNKSRTKIKTPSKRAVAKQKRYAPKTLPLSPQCGHTGKPYQPFQCYSMLTVRDIKYFHEAFYQSRNKISQDQFILKHYTTSNPKRMRKRNEEKNKPKSMMSFMNILGVKKDRILNILKRYKEKNEIPSRRRSSKRKNYNKRAAISNFDCQKNLALHKIPDQPAYLSMQLNFYHFVVVEGSSRGKLNPATVKSYIWTEVDRPRGSNEIPSALFHTLTRFEFSATIIRLFCDGCGAQNKNSTVIGMW
ncbi:hypothetical protein QE152_g12674 [Popillia japonica]|uniref:Uncharacterized protein n=1 Tax=Popillia japonica TaxID=7064 RepID=A0AAW1LIM3_POPJA